MSLGLTWTSWSIPGILQLLVAWSAAVALLRIAPHRSLNRRLATVLFLEGLWGGQLVNFMIEDQALYLLVSQIGIAAAAALPLQYLSFLGSALDTRLVAPFRSHRAVILLGTLSAAAALLVLLSPSTFIGELYSPTWATWNFSFRPWGTRVMQLHGMVSMLGLVAALVVFLKSERGSAARSQAMWFVIAFGLRDVYNTSLWILYPTVRPIPFWGEFIYNVGGPLLNVVYVGLMAYGVLRAQLFDIDLKLKFALKQSTVGAVIAGGFFTGSELLERVIPVESTVLGLITAGVIVLLLRPVQRFAETLTNGIMRGVRDTPDYVESRKHQVYRAALEGAISDGIISERERDILTRLREQLEISTAAAQELEHQLLSGALGT